MAKSQTTDVKFLGQRIVLKTSDNDPETTQEILQLVALKLSEVEARSPGVVPHQIALLALLDLAEEYVKAKKRTSEYKKKLDEKSSQLLGLVEAEFK